MKGWWGTLITALFLSGTLYFTNTFVISAGCISNQNSIPPDGYHGPIEKVKQNIVNKIEKPKDDNERNVKYRHCKTIAGSFQTSLYFADSKNKSSFLLALGVFVLTINFIYLVKHILPKLSIVYPLAVYRTVLVYSIGLAFCLLAAHFDAYYRAIADEIGNSDMKIIYVEKATYAMAIMIPSVALFQIWMDKFLQSLLRRQQSKLSNLSKSIDSHITWSTILFVASSAALILIWTFAVDGSSKLNNISFRVFYFEIFIFLCELYLFWNFCSHTRDHFEMGRATHAHQHN